MYSLEEIEYALSYGGPRDQLARELAESHRSASILIENLNSRIGKVRETCRTAKDDTAEIRWVRKFASEILDLLPEEK